VSELEINKIYCIGNVAGCKSLADNCIDLTVTSPPYDNLRVYAGFEWNFELLVKELYRVTKQGGVVVWVTMDSTIDGSETGTSFKQALGFMNTGFRLHDTMIYLKDSYMPLTHNRYEQAFEYMFVFSKGRPKTFNPIMIPCITAGTTRNRKSSKAKESEYSERRRQEITTVNPLKQHPNVFNYDVGKNDRTLHNAPFPEALAQDQILSWSNEGDVILDPFMGSGTTAKMALLNKRKFIGFEVSQEFCDNARLRLAGCMTAQNGNGCSL